METIKAEEPSSSPLQPLSMPGKLLLQDELIALREIASLLTAQCAVISPIADYYEERLEALLKQRHYTDPEDTVDSPIHLRLSRKVAICGCQPDRDSDNARKSHSLRQANKLIGHQDISGPRGRSGDNPIDAISWDLRRLIERITTLCDTGILQTTSPLSVDRTSLRLSDDGSIHVQTDISIGTNIVPKRIER